jgi:hypothetical protein
LASVVGAKVVSADIWFWSGVPNAGSVSSSSVYVSAPETEAHSSVGSVETSTALSAGDVKVGATGGGGTVVNENVVDHAPGPPGFFPRTLQKYSVLVESALTTANEVVELLESLMKNVEKSDAVETSTRYVSLAPLPALHINVGVNETSVALSAGDVRVGAPGGVNKVVKEREE